MKIKKIYSRLILLLPLGCLVLSFCAFIATAGARNSEGEIKAGSSPGVFASSAGETDHKSLTILYGYLRKAALNNRDLEGAFNRWKASLERIPQVKALPDPRFTFGYFINSVETRVGAQRARVGITQTFPWFGKLDLKGDIALQEANALKEQYDAIKLKVFYEVKKDFYEYAYLTKAIEIKMENLELLRYMESVAMAKYTAGSAPYSDVLRPQVELGKLEDRINSIRDLTKPVVARLLAAMDMPVDSKIPSPPGLPVMIICMEDEEFFRQLPAHNPRLKRYAFLEAREEAARTLAEKEFYPDFTFGLETISTDPALMPDVPDSGKDPIVASVSINIPFWWEKRRAAVREKEFMRLSAAGDSAGLRQSLIADMQLALYRHRDAQRKINLYRETLIPKAEEALGVTLEAFQSGIRSSVDLIDAERLFLEFELSYIRALADQAQTFAQLEMLLGKEIPCRIHDSPIPRLHLPAP